MGSRRMTQMGKWARRIGGALVLALVGLLAPAITMAMIDVGEEVIEVEGEAPWKPPTWTSGHSGAGAPNGTPPGDSGGGGIVPSGSSGGGTIKPVRPPLTTLGEGPSLQTLKDIGFECNGGVGPADVLVCHVCSETRAGEICICYDCQQSSGKCTPAYDCT
jgi:hypothetical protein